MNGERTAIEATADTNLIVSGAVFERGLPRQLLTALRNGTFTLVLSAPLRREYVDVLRRARFARQYGMTAERVGDILEFIDAHARIVPPVTDLPVVVRDPKDAMVLATAIGGGAGYLVTGDADLLVLRDHPALAPLRIVTVREFLDLLPPQ